MNNHPRKFGFCIIGTVTALLTANWQLQAQEGSEPLLPKVVRDLNGFVMYQPVKLKNYALELSEFKNSVLGSTSFMGFSVNKNDENHLSRFRIRVDTAPSPHTRAMPPMHLQAPTSNSTLYDDLDGDSVFDTMVKKGPDLHESYILYKNSWIQVDNWAMDLGVLRTTIKKDKTEHYSFEKNEWKRMD